MIRRLRLPQTVRLRLTLLYGGLFLLAGSTLLAVTYGVVAHSLNVSPSQTHLSAAALGGIKETCESKFVQTGKGGTAPSASRPSISKCEQLLSTAEKAAASAQRERTLNDLLLYSLLGLAATAVLSAVGGWLMAGRVLRPVRAITEAAQRASEHHLGERVGLKGPDDELKRLADTFDDMLDRLDAAFSSQRVFVANASHELRTPLTVMRTAIDVTLSKPSRTVAQLDVMATKVRDAVQQAEQLIESLLTLAKSERGSESRDFTDLATASEDALDAARQVAMERNLDVKSTLEPAELSGDRVLLERMVANLVDNATKYAPDGGWIRMRTGTEHPDVFFEISNNGRKIEDDVVPLLFEPFQRADGRLATDIGGAGLGLAIVKAVVEAHRGTVCASSPSDEGGLQVMVRLPGATND